MVRPAGTLVSPEKSAGPADLTETLRASVEAAKASRARDGASGGGSGGGADSGDKPAAPKRGRAAAQDKPDTPAKPGTSRRRQTA